KILDPVSQPVHGDLYFELHEEKQEVYVVTHVDLDAWPDGTGYIRYGFNPKKLAEYNDGARFRADYLAAVKSYEAVRRVLDAPGSDTAHELSLIERERQLRDTMNSFTHLRPVRSGDVIKVPLLLPHSLQHGVRTIEFQTPVYERKILAFAQQVLTQDHWDTEEAVAMMLLESPPVANSEVLLADRGRLVERIVDFSDFEVQRVVLGEGRALPLEAVEQYALIMVVAGEIAIGERRWGPEQALLLPGNWKGNLAPADLGSELVFLLAMPQN
ncbi:MAG: hypothetical protein HOC23_16160, partial [Halieaceae bacterium]|nr:hypothetical protein [Halieaceae bacterium]